MPILSRATSNFLLMGLDFMITSDLHIQFIETNNYPLWPRGTDSLNNMIQTMGVREDCVHQLVILLNISLSYRTTCSMCC